MIGERRLEQLAQEFDLDVRWKAFQLRPEGVPVVPKPPGYLEAARARFTALAAEEGIELRWNNHKSSSFLAWEGAKYAEERGHFNDYNHRVFKAQFVEDRKIGDVTVLCEIAGEAGMDVEDFRNCLQERRMQEKVRADLQMAQEMMITAVPFFVIGKRAVRGAQPLEVFRQVALLSVNEASNPI
ncbi:MAG: DsbA family oxidoreductase [Bacillota bacterium]